MQEASRSNLLFMIIHWIYIKPLIVHVYCAIKIMLSGRTVNCQLSMKQAVFTLKDKVHIVNFMFTPELLDTKNGQ